MASESYHEPYELLSEDTRNMHRALVSLREELEAIDWYGQRSEACTDAELREILLHNQREEIEHAMMVLEWLRRRSSTADDNARAYLFGTGSIVRTEEALLGVAEAAVPTTRGDLGIGSLKGA